MDTSKGDSGLNSELALMCVVFDESTLKPARSSYFASLSDLIMPGRRTIDLGVEPLHGSGMLPRQSDERKLQAYLDVVTILRECGARGYRVGLRGRPSFIGAESCHDKTAKERTSFAIQWNMSRILDAMQHEFDDETFLPIIELESRSGKAFAHEYMSCYGSIRSGQIASSYLGSSWVSINNIENLMDGSFAPKENLYCQMADVLLYLRNVRQEFHMKKIVSKFKERLRPAIEASTSVMRADETFSCGGSTANECAFRIEYNALSPSHANAG